MQSTISLKKNIQKSISVFYKLIKKLRPKIVLIQGDTTTAAGCAYAASLSGSLVAHNDDIRRKRFLIQEYNLGLSTIQTEKKIGGGRSERSRSNF